jgi:hypothetical protein
MGGTTSIDVTKPGIDKAYGIGKAHEQLDISIKDMLFAGDAIFHGRQRLPRPNSRRRLDPGARHQRDGARHPNGHCLLGRQRTQITSPRTTVMPFKMKRLDLVIEPEPNDPYEVGGILNPAAARGPDGELYLFLASLPRTTTRASAS